LFNEGSSFNKDLPGKGTGFGQSVGCDKFEKKDVGKNVSFRFIILRNALFKASLPFQTMHAVTGMMKVLNVCKNVCLNSSLRKNMLIRKPNIQTFGVPKLSQDICLYCKFLHL